MTNFYITDLNVSSSTLFCGAAQPGEDVYFKLQWLRGVPKHTIQEGLNVEYEAERTDRGLQTKWVKALGSTSSSVKAKPTHHNILSTDNDDFLNPYNFVRPLPTARKEAIVLGDCPPPPHDRYVGLTGRIVCAVEAKTPLFISDSHAIIGATGSHRSYRFFQTPDADGVLQPALPATSLRGMVRSVFEAATNSCFGVFDGGRLSWRPQGEAVKLLPAYVDEEIAEDVEGKKTKTLFLKLLPGTTAGIGDPPKGQPLRAAWVHRYWPIDPSKTLTKDARSYKAWYHDEIKNQQVALNGLEHGAQCYALLTKEEHPHPQINYWRVIEVSNNKDELMKKRKGAQRVDQGYLCLNNQNIENKHSERFFFRDKSSKLPEKLVIPLQVQHDYELLITEYQKRHASTVKKRRGNGGDPGSKFVKSDETESAYSRFIYDLEASKLKKGDLVYVRLINNAQTGTMQIKYIVPVLVPRIWYEKSISDLLSSEDHSVEEEVILKHLQHCRDYEHLCPACRTFGWVREDAVQSEDGVQNDEQQNINQLSVLERTAYAGRVRFSHGVLKHHAGTVDNPKEGIKLAILSTPKPTTTQFYLFSNGQPDATVTYNSDAAELRGRKVYRHHGDAPSSHTNGFEYERATDQDHNGADDQNRTVRGVLKPGTRFEFTVDFENLAPLELGALLWSLQLEDGMYHRLGYAKPLGFGSVTVAIKCVELVKPEERYTSLTVTGWHSVSNWRSWITDFQQQMTILYKAPQQTFTNLVNIADLKALLGNPEIDRIHYPRGEREPQPKGENFRWFVQMKKKPRPLDLPGANESLPLQL
ncbi:MAG: TIGR03986 family CRISPR-associated RAMP protein [Caldilineaceae bacterium]